jgi:hypothetical protein
MKGPYQNEEAAWLEERCAAYRAEIDRLQKRLSQRDEEICSWAVNYDQAVQPLQEANAGLRAEVALLTEVLRMDPGAMILAAMEREREACAEIADRWHNFTPDKRGRCSCAPEGHDAAAGIAQAIRQRADAGAEPRPYKILCRACQRSFVTPDPNATDCGRHDGEMHP